MRIGGVFLSALLSTAATACMNPDPIGGPAGRAVPGRSTSVERQVAPLGENALRQLLSGSSVSAVGVSVTTDSHPAAEMFLSNGAYIRILGRTRVEGLFNIEGTSVCVRGPDFMRQCRQVFPRRDGTYALVDQSNRSTSIVTITPLD